MLASQYISQNVTRKLCLWRKAVEYPGKEFVVVVVYFILSRLLYLDYSANLGLV